MKRFFLSILIAFRLIASIPLQADNKSDFVIKGFHIDLRCQVMTPQALKNFAKELSAIGVNTIIMEWEATFPYQKHATISNKYAYSPAEVKSFIDYCQRLNIDVIPLQNCFGHVEYILRHDRYAHLKEDKKEVSQVCPLKAEECKAVFTEVFKEMAAMHPSRYFHIGGDETYLLGSCKECSAKAKKEGKSKLFVDYVKTMCEIATSMGKQPVLWADIILKYPEAVNELPKNLIYVDWNYGWERDYFGDMDRLFNAGATFWGAPSLRSHPDNLYITQWEKHFNNQRDFIPYARKAGYKGMVMTSWSTSGTYGFSYDTGWEVTEMYPIRYVYPLSGFKILIAAYGESLNNPEPLEPEKFVTKYSKQQFGFTEEEGKLLWQLLKSPQEVVRYGKEANGKSVKEVKEDAIMLRKQMATLTPKYNQTEFEHFRLMLDIRILYLSFKELEAGYQSKDFSRELAMQYLTNLETLLTTAKDIDSRFLQLQKGYLYEEEIMEINRWRSEKMIDLHKTLKQLLH